VALFLFGNVCAAEDVWYQPSPTAVATATVQPSPTAMNTPTPQATATAQPSPTLSTSPTAVATATVQPSPTDHIWSTATPAPTATTQPSPTLSTSPTAVNTATPIPTPTTPPKAYTAGSINLVTQAASIGATNLVAAAPVGLYQVCWFVNVTRAATTSSSILVTIGWNDGVALTKASTAQAGNTTSVYDQACFAAYAAAATNITYATTYASSGATTMQYHLTATAERLN
jgi:hypothetical protein